VVGGLSTTTAAGALIGLVLGVAFMGQAEALLFQVTSTEALILAAPAVAIAGVAVLASLVPVLHALRIDPCRILRVE
jgi:ABC-type antimicrobial peptide transport system permease subunit